MVEIRYYIGSTGTKPFADWFAELDPVAGAKVARAIARMEHGNFSSQATESILGETATRL
jgi:hypothetical protein